MSFFAPADPAARSSLYAVVACTVATLIGAATAWTLSSFVHYTPLIIAASLSAATAFCVGAWRLRHPSLDYDPLSSFSTHLFCIVASAWTIRFFFAEPVIGPFAGAPDTVCDGLANVLFGVTLFILIGATLGATYAAARRAHGIFRWRRALFAAACLTIFVYLMSRAAYMPPL